MRPAPPPAVEHREEKFLSAEGLKLFAQSWRPATSTPTAVLMIVHGLKDHSSRYAALAEELVPRGFAGHAFDLRGHGLSEGARVWVDEFEQYVDDLGRFLALVRTREPGRPIFLFGHSMGGAIVTRYVLEKKKPALSPSLGSGAAPIRGLVLSAPALKPGAEISRVTIAAAKLLGAVTPSLAVLDLDVRLFSRDPAVVRDTEADPLVYNLKGPARTGAELLRTLQWIGERMEDVEVPLLILHGTADRITNPEGSRELAQRARSTDKTLHLYTGLYHDLLHEPERAMVAADLRRWLEARAVAPPAK